MESQTYRRAIDLLEADLSDEMVALDPRQGNCFGFNSVATSVWQLLKQPRTVEQLKSHLMDEYDVTETACEEDLGILLRDLEAKGLIARS